MTAPPGVTWRVDRVVRVVDGDTVRLLRSRVIGVADGLEFTARDTDPRGVAVRLVTLDTPERGQDGYERARADLADWLHLRVACKSGLSVICYGAAGFDRLLGDIHVTGDVGNTASQWMLRDRGWLPWIPT